MLLHPDIVSLRRGTAAPHRAEAFRPRPALLPPPTPTSTPEASDELSQLFSKLLQALL